MEIAARVQEGAQRAATFFLVSILRAMPCYSFLLVLGGQICRSPSLHVAGSIYL